MSNHEIQGVQAAAPLAIADADNLVRTAIDRRLADFRHEETARYSESWQAQGLAHARAVGLLQAALVAALEGRTEMAVHILEVA